MAFRFRDRRTAHFNEECIKASFAIEQAAMLESDRLRAEVDVRDRAALPGYRVKTLKGARKGQYSNRINDQRPI